MIRKGIGTHPQNVNTIDDKSTENSCSGGSQKLLGEVLELLGAMVAHQNSPSLKNKATSALVGSQLEGQNFTLC